MKNRIVLVVFVLALNAAFAINEKTVQFGKEQGLKVKQQAFDGVDFSFSINELKIKENVKKGQFYTELEAENFIPNGKIGFPALPSYKQLIEIPMDAQVEVNITSYDEEIIHLNDLGFINPVIPMQPSLRKDQDPNTVPFYKNDEAYSTDNFIASPLVEVQISGIARSVQFARLVICPLQYNPATNTIKVYKNIQFSLHYKNADYAKTHEYKRKYFSPVFENQIRSVINHSSDILKDQITQYPISYLIVADRMFETTLLPFVQLKTRQGYKVTVGYTDVIGTTTTAIKSYITDLYNNGTPQNPAPTYLLLVGDIAQVPTFSGTIGNHPTDTYYGTMNGSNDYIPDMYIGRISATTTAQLQTILDKILEYEQYQMPDPSYLQYALMVAGVDANNAPTYGNGQINYGTQYYINSSNGITSNTYLYGSGSPIISNSPQAAPAIKQNISDGVGFGNYTAHCGPSGWSDPSVSTSDIPNFTNAHKYGLLIGNCCQSNKFNEAECFGEAILRAANKGAVAYIGASDYSYWDEDYYYSVGVKSITANPTYDSTKLGFYDRLFHSHGESTNDWFVTAAQINYGGNLAVEQSGSNNVYYWEMYHLMGDPSMLPYMGIPTALTASYLNSVPVGTPTLTVTTEPYAYVGLSYNNTWIDAKYTGTGTTVTLDLSSISTPCALDIVITKQNRQPHVGTVQLVPNNTPYVIYQSNVIHDAGVAVNGNVEYSENVDLDVTLSNVGLQDANQVVATLSCSNSHVHITDSIEAYGTINA
ncbi:MAG: C25 family cysteine peptidase, partial [Bacteroidales bacterium]